VRLQAPGYIPSYFWNLEPNPDEPLDTGELDLEVGASVIGWVTVADRNGIARVSLREHSYGVESRRGKLASMSVATNARGFFQFRNVPLGSFVLTAARGESVTWEEQPVDVREASEYRISKLLSIIDPAPLSVNIRPVVAEDNVPWVVALERAIPRTHFVEPPVESPADLNGTWTRATPAGNYILKIQDVHGSIQHRRDIRMDGNPQSIDVDLKRVEIRGRVQVNEQPIQGTLTFRARGSGVTLHSGDDGSFSGVLPGDGQWKVQVHPDGKKMYFSAIPVEVARTRDGSPTTVDIELPSGGVRGTVKDRLGNGVVADVFIWRDQIPIADVLSDTNGAFEIVGLEAGDVFVGATVRAGDSLLVPAKITSGGFAKVDLTIASVKIGGAVRTKSGRPVSGALIRYDNPLILDRRETTTGPSGEFQISLPGEVPFLDLVILAGGRATTIERAPVSQQDKFVEITLEDGSGVLNVLLGGTPWFPSIGRGGALVSLARLFPPTAGGQLPEGFSSSGYTATLSPGTYYVCPGNAMSPLCKEVLVAPFTESTVDFSKKVTAP
jgi:hypothetical protein